MSEENKVWKDRYLIEKELARGGFGVVYLARDQRLLSKPVVVKVLLEEVSPDPYVQKKFRQEIEALARIDHPGIVGVLDVGETPEGKPFLVMQYVEGVTLRSQIGEGGMPLRHIGRLIRQIGQALTAAHEKGVLHRDLKPENIMLQTVGGGEVQVKVIDFGIAAVKDSQVDRTQLTSKIAGTLSYMAPEQVMGFTSLSSDLYSLGVIAFEMVTGVLPENSPQGVLKKPRELRPELSETAQAIVVRALCYRPEERQSRIFEFCEGLAEALGVTGDTDMTLSTGGSSKTHSTSAELEMAYVLFMDLVDFSKLTMEEQTERIQELQAVVRGTPNFQEASRANRLISLPTGDGIALVFFQNPVTPVLCATEISRALAKHPLIRLRMGVHTGPVYRIDDINANRNVTGGGINMAQRVMDGGDAGHILLSKSFADVLIQLSDWAHALHDIGEVSIKHGSVHLVNLYTADFGNPALPSKVSSQRNSTEIAAGAGTTGTAPKSRTGLWVGIAAAAVAVLGIGYYLRFQSTAPKSPEVPPQVQPAQPAQQKVETPPAQPTPKTPPPPAKAAEPAPEPPKAATPDPKPAEPANNVVEPATRPPVPPPPNGFRPPLAGPGRGNVAAQLRQRVTRLNNRQAAASRGFQSLVLPPNRRGNELRQEATTAREEFQRLINVAVTALDNGDLPTAALNLDLADKEVARIENIINRRGPLPPRGQ